MLSMRRFDIARTYYPPPRTHKVRRDIRKTWDVSSASHAPRRSDRPRDQTAPLRPGHGRGAAEREHLDGLPAGGGLGRVQGRQSQASMSAILVVVVVLAVLVGLLVALLTRVSQAYEELSGDAPGARRTSPWLRSMRGEREDLVDRRRNLGAIGGSSWARSCWPSPCSRRGSSSSRARRSVTEPGSA